jgi:hypothetical protein
MEKNIVRFAEMGKLVPTKRIEYSKLTLHSGQNGGNSLVGILNSSGCG